MVEKTTYTLAQAAELLSCHKETLRRAIKAGTLRAAKIGKEYRISKTDLEDYWAARGGGALFDDSPRPLPRPEEKKTEKPKGPEQLKLPT
ncbi:MAG: DNA-binding protein [Desulfovibrio sp.]|nr:MAG: DNA-binding protein [Desulfovibrio sp.]